MEGWQFDDWIEVKKEVHESNRVQAMKEGEIWLSGNYICRKSR